jgi:hypothetical protein
MLFFPNGIELSMHTSICRSPILHLTKGVSTSKSCDTSKRCVVQLSMDEDTYSLERVIWILQICIGNNRNSMWKAVIECTDIKNHRDLFHIFYRSVFKIFLIGMNHSVFVILLELIIFLLEILEVVEEVI